MKKNCFLKMVVFLSALTISPHLFAVPSMKIQFSGKASVRGSTPSNNSVCLYLAIVNKAQTSTSWSNDGTSTNGGQPTACVTVSTSTTGEFSVTLGDTTLTNMTALPESAFNTTTSDLYLAVWLQASNAFSSFSAEQLTPNILLTSAPYAAGASTITVGGPQVLTVNTTAVGNVGEGEDDLMTYTLPANTLKNTGQTLRITAWGSDSTGSTTIRHRCYFGSTNVSGDMTVTASPTSVASWKANIIVTRISSTSQEVGCDAFIKTTSALAGVSHTRRSSLAENLGAAITIKCTGQSADGSVADNNAQQTGLIVELLN